METHTSLLHSVVKNQRPHQKLLNYQQTLLHTCYNKTLKSTAINLSLPPSDHTLISRTHANIWLTSTQKPKEFVCNHLRQREKTQLLLHFLIVLLEVLRKEKIAATWVSKVVKTRWVNPWWSFKSRIDTNLQILAIKRLWPSHTNFTTRL